MLGQTWRSMQWHVRFVAAQFARGGADSKTQLALEMILIAAGMANKMSGGDARHDIADVIKSVVLFPVPSRYAQRAISPRLTFA